MHSFHSGHGGEDWARSEFHGRGHGKTGGKGKTGFHGYQHSKVLGITVVGERGQVVIPREAREEIGIESGDRFVVFGNKSKGSVMLVKSDVFDHFAEVFMAKSQKLEQMAQEIWAATQATEKTEGEEAADEAESDFEPAAKEAPIANSSVEAKTAAQPEDDQADPAKPSA